MDELKSENKQQTENEFKPDTSDRRPQRPRNRSNQPKLAISRQQMMIGVGILVLLLLIIAISSALKSPTEHEKQLSSDATEKSIDLSGSSSLSPETQGSEQENSSISEDKAPTANESSINGPREISPPPVSSTPSKDLAPATRAGGYNQRIELPGDITDALNQQQNNINNSVQKNLTPPQIKPTSTPPVEQKKMEKITPPKIENKGREENQPKAATKTVTGNNQASHNNHINTKSAGGDLLKAPANRFTLQLSSASRSDTLIAFAKKQNLTGYKVYETKRDGKVWFILIHGNYGSVSDAKIAISSLPVEVQAKKPWVRKLQQVQQDLKR